MKVAFRMGLALLPFFGSDATVAESSPGVVGEDGGVIQDADVEVMSGDSALAGVAAEASAMDEDAEGSDTVAEGEEGEDAEEEDGEEGEEGEEGEGEGEEGEDAEEEDVEEGEETEGEAGSEDV